jgi:hypothetical protein
LVAGELRQHGHFDTTSLRCVYSVTMLRPPVRFEPRVAPRGSTTDGVQNIRLYTRKHL